MVQAILDGRKTMTRRVCKNIPLGDKGKPEKYYNKQGNIVWGIRYENFMELSNIKCPYGKVGDRIWVKETFSDAFNEGANCICYKADYERIYIDEDKLDQFPENYTFSNWAPDLESGQEGRWRPSIFMPRIASRILLEITNIRVEQLNSITPKDALAEGITYEQHYEGLGNPCDEMRMLDAFQDLWQSINGAESWYKNPWVWVVEFKTLEIKS